MSGSVVGAGGVSGDQDSQGPCPREGDILVRQVVSRQIKSKRISGSTKCYKGSQLGPGAIWNDSGVHTLKSFANVILEGPDPRES